MNEEGLHRPPNGKANTALQSGKGLPVGTKHRISEGHVEANPGDFKFWHHHSLVMWY